MFPHSSVRGLALACALSALASPVFAGFEGRLLTQEGEPASGYFVTVAASGTTVPCDADGRFLLDPAPTPPFEIFATGQTGNVVGPIVVEALAAGLVELTLPPVLTDSITVVSGLAPSLEVAPGNAATVVTQQELEQRAPQRLVNVLESVAGASRLDGGADAVPVLRGLARGRTLILLDGARVTTERRAGPSASYVEPGSLASVEVLRGPSSVVYGSDAFGGVINAISRDPEAGRFRLSFGAEAGLAAFDLLSGTLAVSTDLAGGGLLINVHAREAEDAEDGAGERIFNSAYAGSGVGVRYAHDVGPGRLRLGLTVDRGEDQGKPDVDSRTIRTYYPKEESDRFNVAWSGLPGGGWDALEAGLFVGRYRLLLDRNRVATPTAARRIDRSDVEANDASLRIVAGRPLAGGRLQLGLDTNARFNLEAATNRITFARDDNTVASTSPARSIEDGSQNSYGTFALWKRPIGSWLNVDLGLRGDRVESQNRGGFFGDREQSHSALSGNVGLSASFADGFTASLSAARGFRSPTLSDRYFRGPSGRGFVTGNPDLDPETSQQFDLSLRYGRGRTAVGLYAYHYTIEDLIERFRIGDDFFFRNRGEATIQGLELEGQTTFTDHLSADLGLAWADGEADGGSSIDDIAAPNGWFTLRYSFAKGYVYGRLTALLDKDDPGPTENERDGATLLDLGSGWRFAPGFELRVIARNLTDERYITAADEAATFSPGRSVTVALSGRLGSS